MDLAKTRQLLLVALSSGHPNEAFNALTAIKTLLTKASKDIHWLTSSLGSPSAPASDPRLGILQARLDRLEQQHMMLMVDYGQLKRENASLKSQLAFRAPPPGATSGLTPQTQARQLLNNTRLTLKERDFLLRIRDWSGTPTDKQLAWLADLWAKYS